MEKICVAKEFNEKSDFDEKLNWSKTAKWHFSRLQLGRHEADGLVEAEKQSIIITLPPPDQLALQDPQTPRIQKATIMKPVIEQAVETIFQRAWGVELRPLQYIINQAKNQIVTVATRNHTTIPSYEISQTVETTLQELGYKIQEQWHKTRNLGVLATNKTLETPFGTMKTGLAIGVGNWVTTRAISAGYYFEIGICTNPLTFLGLSNTMGSKIGLSMGKVLRIGNPSDIFGKTKTLITNVVRDFNTDALPEIMIHNGQTEFPLTEAKTVIAAMGNAYAIGKTVQTEIIDQYQNHTKNIWELAMIISKISTDDDNFRKDAVRTPAKLAAIALVLLTTTELKKVVANSVQYCTENAISL